VIRERTLHKEANYLAREQSIDKPCHASNAAFECEFDELYSLVSDVRMFTMSAIDTQKNQKNMT
jgi:hypothetical protein